MSAKLQEILAGINSISQNFNLQANQDQASGEERLMRSWGMNTDNPKYIK